MILFMLKTSPRMVLIASSETASREEIYHGLSNDEIWLADRLRDIHDLQHVMTGYGRDPVGEIGLLSFMTTQTPNRGINFIIWIAKWKYLREVPQFDVRQLIDEGAASLAALCGWPRSNGKRSWRSRFTLCEKRWALRHRLDICGSANRHRSCFLRRKALSTSATLRRIL